MVLTNFNNFNDAHEIHTYRSETCTCCVGARIFASVVSEALRRLASNRIRTNWMLSCCNLILWNLFYMFRPMKVHHQDVCCRTQALWRNVGLRYIWCDDESWVMLGSGIYGVTMNHEWCWAQVYMVLRWIMSDVGLRYIWCDDESWVYIIRGRFNKQVTNREWKEQNGDNYIQTTFIFQHNLHTNLNTCPTVSQVPRNLHTKFPAWRSPPADMFVFDTCPPFRELLHPIMDCLTWQAMFTVHGQGFFVDILCFHFFCPQKKTHNATLLYRGTCTQGRRHLVTAATSVQSCVYRSLCVTIKLDSAAI